MNTGGVFVLDGVIYWADSLALRSAIFSYLAWISSSSSFHQSPSTFCCSPSLASGCSSFTLGR